MLKIKYKFYRWLMGIAGSISAWAWREHVKILRADRDKKTVQKSMSSGLGMIWNKKFEYPTSTRALINGKRHYDVGVHEKLPSVTTILTSYTIRRESVKN